MDSGRQPGPYDINGSANFFNKSDFVISVQRNRRDEEDTSVTIGVGKVKFKNYGKQGSIELLYDEASGNYYSEEFDALAFLDDENVEPNGYTPDDFIIPPISKNEDPLNVEVSVYAGTSDNIGEIQNLKDFLMTDKYKTIAEAIRKGSTPEERHDIKTKFKHSIPCATVSASFSKREAGSLLRPTGLLCIDVDYKDNKLFAGTYDMVPCDGAYWPCDTTYNVKIGKSGKVQDFEVTPYLHVVDFQQALAGTELTLSCKLQAPVVENLPQVVEVRPFLSLNEHCGAANRINYYYTDTYRVNIRKMWNKIGDADGNGLETYSITMTVKPGYTYWCRMGVQVNNTYKNWNYSEVVKITVPKE